MNKYAARGLINEAFTNGKKVVVIAHNAVETRRVFDEFVRQVERMKLVEIFGTRIMRAKGQERILCGVGTIHFASPRMNGLGVSADVVFIDNEADRTAFGDDHERHRAFLNDVNAMVATGGEVIRS